MRRNSRRKLGVMSRGLILGIESSCDETAAAVVERGARTLSSVVASQIATHARFGGVVPELASREHLRAIVPVVRAALAEAGVGFGDLDAIAVTSGPGLAGALLVGITYAKALAFARGLPLIAVNHLEGHIHAVLLEERQIAGGNLEGVPQGLKPLAEAGSGVRAEALTYPVAEIDVDEEELGLKLQVQVAGNAGGEALTYEPHAQADKDVRAEQAEGKRLISNEIPEKHASGAKAPVDSARDIPGINPRPTARTGSNIRADALTYPRTESYPSTELDVDEALALVVSGGHTHLYLAQPAQGTWSYKLIGRTLDDAAGEAFDKVAKLLGLGYPGGPWIDALARFGDPKAVPFSFAQIKTKLHLAGKAPRTKAAKTAPIADLDPHFLFSFSGIKTAVLRYVELHGLREGVNDRIAAVLAGARPPKTKEEALTLCPQAVLDLVASFQHAVVGDLMKKTFAAAESLGAKRILVTGGVAANRELRERFSAEAARRGVTVAFPTPALSTDNAAMIAAAAWPRFLAGEFADSGLSGDPSLVLGH
jgi:glycoprotease/Kae1 family metallohydrolase